MRRIFLFSLVWVFIGSFLISALYAAEIIYIKGRVQVQYAVEQGSWKQAKTGMSVNIGDSIKTARSSRTDIAIDEAKTNVIQIDQNTLLILDSSSPGELNRLDLSHGKIYANIETVKAGLNFEVSTPSAVAGVRGTGWSVESKEKQDEVACYEDSVFVQAYDAMKNLITEITVGEGFKTIIERFNRPSELIGLTNREINQWNQVKDEISERVKEKPKQESMTKGSKKLNKISKLQEKTEKNIDDIKKATEEKRINDEMSSEEESGPMPW